MAEKRDEIFVWVTWLTKLLAGEENCLWKLWFKAHHRYDKLPSGFDLAKWAAEHTDLVERRGKELRAQGYSVRTEAQNAFKLEGQNGAVLSGKADLVAESDAEIVLIDCKTGREKHSDKLQVLLYMLALPLVVPRYRHMTIGGEVQYVEYKVPVDPSGVNHKFKAMLREKMDVAAGSTAPGKVPSFGECRFCDIPSSECAERVDEETGQMKTDLF